MVAVLAAATAAAGWWMGVEQSAAAGMEQALRAALEQTQQASLETRLVRELRVPRGLALADVLAGSGVAPESAYGVVQAAQSVFDLRRVRAGNRLAVERSLVGELRTVSYQIDPENTLWVTPEEDPEKFRAEILASPAATETVTAVGELKSSLWEAILESGEGPELVLLIADIFGWDIDFNTETRTGDTFRVAVEKKTYADGSVRYTRVLAAEYNNQGHAYQAVLFRDAGGRPAYYAPDGSSLQKMFLRSPLVFGGRVTSRFSRARLHPILRRVRPHLGTDYYAPTGSPVQSIGSGRVLSAGWKGGGGRTVHIRHANGYETMYLHLSRILVRPGERVQQGQRVGLVGSTGLATGPHLDFRITQNGKYRNFEALRLPPATPVAKKDWSEFAAARDQYMALLPPPVGAVQQARTSGRPSAQDGARPSGGQ
jgi:murein DD-endopeptidase MepM/ murein hydrolase activator NlpD